MNFILIVFLYTNMAGGPVGIVHKKYQNLEQCQAALQLVKSKPPVSANVQGAARCISVDELLELNQA